MQQRTPDAFHDFTFPALINAGASEQLLKAASFHDMNRSRIFRKADAINLRNLMLFRDHRQKSPDCFCRVSVAGVLLRYMVADFPAVIDLGNLHMADVFPCFEQNRIDKRSIVTAIPANQKIDGFLFPCVKLFMTGSCNLCPELC